MIKTTFKAHPIMVPYLMKPYLFVLVLPLIRAIYQYLTTKTVDGLLTLELIAFSLVLSIAYLSYRAVSVTISGNRLTVKKGVFVRRRAVIELTRLSCVALKRNLLDYLFGSVECSINTEAGRSKSSDFSFRMYYSDVNRLTKMIYGDDEREIIKFSPTKIALLAATTSSAVSGMIVGVPLINQLGDMLGVAISDMLLNRINNISVRMQKIAPPIVNTVTLIMLAAYGVAFLMSFLKNINFTLKSDEKVAEIKSGLLTRRHIMFKKADVNNVCIEQTPLMSLVKRFSLRASIGGYANSNGEKAVVVPIASYNGLKEQLTMHFPEFVENDSYLEPKRDGKTRARFFFMPILWFWVIVGVGVASAVLLEHFDATALFVSATLLCLNIYYAFVCYKNYRRSRFSLKNSVFASGMRGFNARELYCDKNNIGIIKITRTPADRRYNTCKIKLTVRSEKADSIRVKLLNTDMVTKEIKAAYDIKSIINV